MAYVIKWLKPTGAFGQSEPHASPSDALRFSRTLAALRPEKIWAEDDLGHQFRITVEASAFDD
jgi:hypothetical protein